MVTTLRVRLVDILFEDLSGSEFPGIVTSVYNLINQNRPIDICYEVEMEKDYLFVTCYREVELRRIYINLPTDFIARFDKKTFPVSEDSFERIVFSQR
jgi:hypothetical protein